MAFFKSFQFSRPFWILITGSLINKAGNFVIPFFALYLTSFRHLSVSEATLIVSLMGFGPLVAGVCGGILADTFGRRITILVSLLTAAGIMLALSFAGNVSLIVVLAILYELFSGLAMPAIAAAIADMTPRDKLAQAYSLPYWAHNIGSAVGPIIAGLLAPISYLLLFLGDALTTFCFGILVCIGVPETRPLLKKQTETKAQRPAGVRTALADPWLWGYALLAFLFDAVYIQDGIAMPLDMQAHGLNPLAYGSVMALNAVLVVLMSLPLASFFARRSPHTALSIASLLLGVGMGLFSWLTTYPGYVLGVIIWTIGEILYSSISPIVIANIAPSHLRGTYQGIFQTIRALAVVIAPALAGIVLQHLGATIFWRSCFVIGLFTATGYFLLGKALRAQQFRLALRAAEPLRGISKITEPVRVPE
jgi:MFS family permease